MTNEERAVIDGMAAEERAWAERFKADSKVARGTAKREFDKCRGICVARAECLDELSARLAKVPADTELARETITAFLAYAKATGMDPADGHALGWFLSGGHLK